MVRFGGNYFGVYYAMKNVLVNENSVYKHQHLSLYVQYYQTKIRFAHSLDLDKDGWVLEFGDYTGLFSSWNGTNFVPDPAFQIETFEQLPEDPPVIDNIPCKLQMSSEGPLGSLFPDQMGVYKLIENDLVY